MHDVKVVSLEQMIHIDTDPAVTILSRLHLLRDLQRQLHHARTPEEAVGLPTAGVLSKTKRG